MKRSSFPVQRRADAPVPRLDGGPPSAGLRILTGAAAGALLMYYFDPGRGRYRRSILRDRCVHAGRRLQAGLDTTARDMRNRASGAVAALRAWFGRMPASDQVLAERVHAKIGRIVSHPGSIEVTTRDGLVTLSGPILAEEVPRLIDSVLDVPGVTGVVDRLEVHVSPEHVPGLQGGAAASGERSALLQRRWSPTVRALAGTAGAGAVLYALNRRRAPSAVVGGTGLLLLARAATNIDLRRLFGVGGSRYVVEVQKAIRIHAPVEKVFGVWSDFERFPQVMKHVRRVRALADGRKEKHWRWTVRGPTGLDVDFDTAVTAFEPNRLIGWRTDAGAAVQHAGRAYFHPNTDGTTTVDIKMVYSPVAGALGHALARLLRADPKHRLDDDLLRLKTYIETGVPPHDAARPRRASEVPLPAAETQPGLPH